MKALLLSLLFFLSVQAANNPITNMVKLHTGKKQVITSLKIHYSS